MDMLHTNEETTCNIVDAPDNYHFQLRCEDCDVKAIAVLNRGQVEDRYNTGRVTQDEFEAYMHVWALLSSSRSGGSWRATPDVPAVRRIARKLLRRRNAAIPVELREFDEVA